MKYSEALKFLRQYNKEYAIENQIIKAVTSILDHIIEDSENKSKEDLIECVKQVKNEVSPS